MQMYYKVSLLLIAVAPFGSSLENEDNGREQRLLSSFQIVRFPNDACTGSGMRNGTCYTSQECSNKGGASSGSCADGFGVCCTFVITSCGTTSSENLTSWTVPANLNAANPTACDLTVCPVSSGVCSIRLDFTLFTITGPSTVSIAQARRRFGTPVGNLPDQNYVQEGTSFATNCLLDTFSVQGASVSSNPPSVCGTLTGEHMYVEADADRCNKLQFNLAGTTFSVQGQTNERGANVLANRNWDITATQIECSNALLPPPGCTKFYWGGIQAAQYDIQSYNFGAGAGTTHLASQHERICIRRERGNCIGCFTAVNAANVMLSGVPVAANANGLLANANGAVTYTHAGGCCGYHTRGTTGSRGNAAANVNTAGQSTAAGMTTVGFDCIIIPGAYVPVNGALGVPIVAPTTANLQNLLAANAANTGSVPAPPQICGNNAGLGIGAINLQEAVNLDANNAVPTSNINHPICTRNVPFTLEFMSDDLEGLGTTANTSENTVAGAFNRGFMLRHTQVPCAANAAG